MTTARLPRRVRAGVAVVLVLLVAMIVAGTVVIQYGARVLRISDGDVQSVASTTAPTWAGFELSNTSAFPVTLHAVRAVGASNTRILDARVVERKGSGGFGLITEPLPADLVPLLAASRPVDGFALPPHSGGRYQLVVELVAVAAGRQASLSQTALTYSVVGVDQGVVSHAVFCIRRIGSERCAPFD